MEPSIVILLLAISFAVGTLYILSVSWAIGDAQRRGRTGAGVVFLFCLFGPLGAIVWYCVRPTTKVSEQKLEDFSNVDDALAAASQLDTLGDWSKAISVYEIAAKRWPDHKPYIGECINRIKEKQSLSEQHRS